MTNHRGLKVKISGDKNSLSLLQTQVAYITAGCSERYIRLGTNFIFLSENEA